MRGIEIVKFMTLLRKECHLHGQKRPYFQKYSSVLPQMSEKTTCMVMTFIKLLTKFVKFVASGEEVKTSGWVQYGYIVNMYHIS